MHSPVTMPTRSASYGMRCAVPLEGDLRSRLCELAQQRRRFGYRRLYILLRRDGITIIRNKTQRLYREKGWKSDTVPPEPLIDFHAVCRL